MISLTLFLSVLVAEISFQLTFFFAWFLPLKEKYESLDNQHDILTRTKKYIIKGMDSRSNRVQIAMLVLCLSFIIFSIVSFARQDNSADVMIGVTIAFFVLFIGVYVSNIYGDRKINKILHADSFQKIFTNLKIDEKYHLGIKKMIEVACEENGDVFLNWILGNLEIEEQITKKPKKKEGG